jgi:hypothetical protein
MSTRNTHNEYTTVNIHIQEGIACIWPQGPNCYHIEKDITNIQQQSAIHTRKKSCLPKIANSNKKHITNIQPQSALHIQERIVCIAQPGPNCYHIEKQTMQYQQHTTVSHIFTKYIWYSIYIYIFYILYVYHLYMARRPGGWTRSMCMWMVRYYMYRHVYLCIYIYYLYIHTYI